MRYKKCFTSRHTAAHNTKMWSTTPSIYCMVHTYYKYPLQLIFFSVTSLDTSNSRFIIFRFLRFKDNVQDVTVKYCDIDGTINCDTVNVHMLSHLIKNKLYF